MTNWPLLCYCGLLPCRCLHNRRKRYRRFKHSFVIWRNHTSCFILSICNHTPNNAVGMLNGAYVDYANMGSTCFHLSAPDCRTLSFWDFSPMRTGQKTAAGLSLDRRNIGASFRFSRWSYAWRLFVAVKTKNKDVTALFEHSDAMLYPVDGGECQGWIMEGWITVCTRDCRVAGLSVRKCFEECRSDSG